MANDRREFVTNTPEAARAIIEQMEREGYALANIQNEGDSGATRITMEKKAC